MKEYTFNNVNKVVVTVALQVAKAVVILINRGNDEEEDIVRELVEYGQELEQNYIQLETGSLKGYLNKFLKWKGNDILKRYKAQKRNFIRQVCDEDTQETYDNYSRDMPEWRKKLCEAVRQVMEEELGQDEFELAQALTDGSSADAERELKWSHGKTMRNMAKLREKFKKFRKKEKKDEKQRTFAWGNFHTGE